MTQGERAALVERLRATYTRSTYASVSTVATPIAGRVPILSEECLINPTGPEAADQIEADGQRIAELEAFQQQAIKQVCELAREAGEAKGKLEGSELPGIVDGWREKCEAQAKRIAELEAAMPASPVGQPVAYALTDPTAVHVNMLRGTIAKPPPRAIWHIYGDELLAAMPAETPLYPADTVKALVEALGSLLALGPDHDSWCAIGPIYNCTCDLHPARQSARKALALVGGVSS